METKNCLKEKGAMVGGRVGVSPIRSSRCTTSAFGDMPCRMLKAVQRFGKHYTSHLQGECVLSVRFWKPYIEQAITW
jgi:hypothetical protein